MNKWSEKTRYIRIAVDEEDILTNLKMRLRVEKLRNENVLVSLNLTNRRALND